MKLTSAIALLLAVAALILAGLSCQKASDMKPEAVPAVKGGIKPVTGDDQPILVVGGSFSMFNDNRADWTDPDDGTYTYTPRPPSAPSVSFSLSSVDISYNNAMDLETHTTRKRLSGQAAKIEILYKKSGNDEETLVFTTGLDGKLLKLEIRDKKGDLSSTRLKKLNQYFRSHPKKKWATESIKFSGFDDITEIKPFEGVFNLEIHYYCAACP